MADVFEESVSHRAKDPTPWLTVNDAGVPVRMVGPVELTNPALGQTAIVYQAVPIGEDEG